MYGAGVSKTFFRDATIPARGEGRSAVICTGGPVPPREGPTDKKDENPDRRGQLGERISSLVALKLDPRRNCDLSSVTLEGSVLPHCSTEPVATAD